MLRDVGRRRFRGAHPGGGISLDQIPQKGPAPGPFRMFGSLTGINFLIDIMEPAGSKIMTFQAHGGTPQTYKHAAIRGRDIARRAIYGRVNRFIGTR